MKKKKVSVKKQKVDYSRQQNLRKKIQKNIERNTMNNTPGFPEVKDIEAEINSLTTIDNCAVTKKANKLKIQLLVEAKSSPAKALADVKTCLLVRFNFPVDERVFFKLAKLGS